MKNKLKKKLVVPREPSIGKDALKAYPKEFTKEMGEYAKKGKK